jgi:DNA-directed RNA polymerase specialized sigma24 family protein
MWGVARRGGAVPNTATGCQLAEGDRATATEGRALGLPEQVTDAIRRHREGDRTALTDLVRIVSPWLQAVARGFGLSHYSAEDVAQTTLLALLRHVDTIRQPEAGLAWLAVTARHEATRVARAERAAELVPDLGTDEPQPPTSDPEAITMERLRRKLVWRHVAVLPARGQLILHEIASGGRPDYASISGRTGMPVGSIGPTRQRSLQRVRRLLESDQEWSLCA